MAFDLQCLSSLLKPGGHFAKGRKMKPGTTITNEDGSPIEVVVGVFDTHADAGRVAASLRGPNMNMQRVSRSDPAVPSQIPQIVYDDIDEVSSDDIVNGSLKGGAIGAASGLLLLGVPVLNVAAPIIGALAGAWIGAIAGVDEAIRGVELPNQNDYRKMLADGKSFVVIAGEETKRIEYGKQMSNLGAKEIHQHPPVGQMVRNPE